jgi:hypothetical protein
MIPAVPMASGADRMDRDDKGNNNTRNILGGGKDKGKMAMIAAATGGWDSTRVSVALSLEQLVRRVCRLAVNWRQWIIRKLDFWTGPPLYKAVDY